MEIKDLETRIEKKKADIEKTNRSINKFISKNSFSIEDQEVAQTYNWREVRDYANANWPERDLNGNYIEANYWTKIDFEDLHRRYDTLKDQSLTLQKYENQLTLMKAKADKESNTERIPVIVEYLNWLKQRWIEHIQAGIKYYEDTYIKAYNEWWDFYQNSRYTAEDRAHLKELREKRDLAHTKCVKTLDRAVIQYYNQSNGTFDWDACNKELDKDIDGLYWDLVQRVTKVVGEIVDASGLYIGDKGNLNGLVRGTEGVARVETIPAGGYNIQRFHFRTLVKPLRGE